MKSFWLHSAMEFFFNFSFTCKKELFKLFLIFYIFSSLLPPFHNSFMFDLIAVVIKRNEREEEMNKNKEKIQQRWEKKKNYSKRSKNGLQNVVWALKDSWHQSQTSALVRRKFVLFHHSFFFLLSSFNSTLCCTCNVIYIFICCCIHESFNFRRCHKYPLSLWATMKDSSCFWQMIFFVNNFFCVSLYEWY